MNTLKILRARPELFFRLSSVRVVNFDKLVKDCHPLWLKSEHKRLSRKDENALLARDESMSLISPRSF